MPDKETLKKSSASWNQTMLKLSMEGYIRRLLQVVHINMPWRQLPCYMESITEFRLNVELGFEAKHMDGEDRRHFETVSKKLHQAGCRISLHGPFWDLCPGSSDQMIRQVTQLRLNQFFDLIPIFQPVRVVCHTGYDNRHHGFHFNAWLQRALTVWEPLVVRAEQMRVPFLLENVWEPDPYLHRRVFDHFQSPYCGFCLDVGHQHSFSKTALDEWLEVLLPELDEVHIHDNDGSADAHLPVGKGNIDFELLFQRLWQKEDKPLLTLEPHEEEHLVESLHGLARLSLNQNWEKFIQASDPIRKRRRKKSWP